MSLREVKLFLMGRLLLVAGSILCLLAGVSCRGVEGNAPLIPEPQAVYFYQNGRVTALSMSDTQQVQVFRENAGRLIESADLSKMTPVEAFEPSSVIGSPSAVQAIFTDPASLRSKGPKKVSVLLVPLNGPDAGTFYVLREGRWFKGYGDFRMAVEGLYAQGAVLRGESKIPGSRKGPFLSF